MHQMQGHEHPAQGKGGPAMKTEQDLDRLQAWGYLFGCIEDLPGLQRRLREVADDANAPAGVRDLAADLVKWTWGAPS